MAARDTAGTANGGLDVVMPARGSPVGQPARRRGARGHRSAEVIDEHVAPGAAAGRQGRRADWRRGGCAAARTGRSPSTAPELAREIAARSFVLASNRGGALPLDPVVAPQRRPDRRAGQGRQGARRRQRDRVPRPRQLPARGAVRRATAGRDAQLRGRHRPARAPGSRRGAGLDRPARGVQGRRRRRAARHLARHRRRPVDGAASRASTRARWPASRSPAG